MAAVSHLPRCALAAALLFLALLAAGGASAADGLASAARAAGLEFGVALGPADAEASADLIRRNFTSLTAENAMKWRSLAPAEDAYDFSGADALVDFAAANGLRVRGHTLVWSRLNGLPRWLDEVLAAGERPTAALRRLVAAHVDATVGRYAGRIEQWDVVNEPLAFPGRELDPDNIFLATGGETALVDAFRLAAAADPGARLYLNEIGLEEDAERFDAFVALVERLRAAGAPVHGVGLQGHFFKGPPDGATLKAALGRLAALGFDTEITELDLPIGLFQGAPDPLAAQAEAFAAVIAACLAVKRCHGVTVWGLTDATSWRGPEAQAVLFDGEGHPKPAHSAILATLRQAAQDRIR